MFILLYEEYYFLTYFVSLLFFIKKKMYKHLYNLFTQIFCSLLSSHSHHVNNGHLLFSLAFLCTFKEEKNVIICSNELTWMHKAKGIPFSES